MPSALSIIVHNSIVLLLQKNLCRNKLKLSPHIIVEGVSLLIRVAWWDWTDIYLSAAAVLVNSKVPLQKQIGAQPTYCIGDGECLVIRVAWWKVGTFQLQ